ncbi:hypothetical protein [Kribbella solani]|uniref:hypothetical protein n=1 Tax=Kribbella solani TaxID=236067 RepID=UPI0029AFB981|nr:hypothetical protein [Kribbella solani]MDX2969093.1 hypothetical protein [Kribbella solani]
MTGGVDNVRSLDAHANWTLRSLPLPGHVIVRTPSGWRRGWLVARENGPTGWLGLVQYEIDNVQFTEYLSADRIASPDIWLPSEPGSGRLGDGVPDQAAAQGERDQGGQREP